MAAEAAGSAVAEVAKAEGSSSRGAAVAAATATGMEAATAAAAAAGRAVGAAARGRCGRPPAMRQHEEATGGYRRLQGVVVGRVVERERAQ